MGMTDPENANRSTKSSGPSKSSPAGGAQAAGGYTDGSRTSSGSRSSSSSGGGDTGRYGGGTTGTTGQGFGGKTGSQYSGSGSRGGTGEGDGGRSSRTSNHAAERERDTSLSGRSFSNDGARPSRTSPAAGAQAASGFGDGSRVNAPGFDALSGASRSTAGKTATGFAGLTGGGSQRLAEDASMRALGAFRTSPRMAEESSMRSFYTDWLDRAGVVDRIIGVESGGNASAKNPKSSATGAGQFIESTWDRMMKTYRPDLYSTLSRPEMLALRTDPALSREMTAKYAEENIGRLRSEGVPVTPGSVYMAHFAGPAGAVAVYKADPTAPASSVFSRDAIRANGNILTGTIGDVRAWADRKMSGSTQGLMSDFNGPAPVPELRPSFVDRYLMPRADPIQEARADQRMMRAAAAPPAPPPASERQMRSPRSMEGPGGIFLDAPPPQQDERIAAERAREVAAAPAPTAASPAAPAATAPAVEAEKAKRTGGLGGAIVAGGIDLLVGGAPGVGLVNTLAGLFTEGGSLGERIVDDFLSGDSQSVSDTASFKSGDSAVDRGELLRPEEEEGESEGESQSKTAAKAFEERYLLNLWRPDLPTPRQKWPGLLG